MGGASFEENFPTLQEEEDEDNEDVDKRVLHVRKVNENLPEGPGFSTSRKTNASGNLEETKMECKSPGKRGKPRIRGPTRQKSRRKAIPVYITPAKRKDRLSIH